LHYLILSPRLQTTMRAIVLALACGGSLLSHARRTQPLDYHHSQSAPSSSKALANFLISAHGADAPRRSARSSLTSTSGGRMSELSRVRGGASALDDLETLDDESLLNLDIKKAKPSKQAPPAKMKMPSAEEIQNIMNDPQYQASLKQMMSDPNFQEEMKKAAEQMREIMTPEDLEMLEKLQNDPNFMEQAKKIADQMASDPEFGKQVKNQAAMMQDMVAQTMKDPAAMKQLQQMMEDPAMKDKAKAAMKEIAQMLPADQREELLKLLDDPDFEEKMKQVAEEMAGAGTLEDFLKTR